MIPEKLYQKSRLLFNSSKKNLGKEHKGKKKKKRTQTLRLRSREQRSSLLRQKQKYTLEEE